MTGKFLLTALLLAAALSLSANAQTPAQPEAATGESAKSLVRAKRHMIVAAHPLAAKAGRGILREGGSAVDAAIAAQMVLNLVEPQSSGIGGGGFLLHWDATAGKLKSYDGRETAPAAAREDRFLTPGGAPMDFRAARRSALAAGVPGLLRMLEMAHKRHGRLPWAELFAPAIRLSEQGFSVGNRLHRLLRRAGPGSFNAVGRRYFFGPGGKPRPVGHVLKNPAFARVLRLVADKGADGFYEGDTARSIVDALSSASSGKSGMSLKDISGYAAKERPPVCAPYRAVIVCGMGPPSSGGLTVAQTLLLLDAHNLETEPLNADALHKIAEAEKLAYADRGRYMADSDFVPVPSGLLDPAYLAERRRLIGREAMPKAEPGVPPGAENAKPGADSSEERPGTSHVSVIDERGNAVSMTTTIESAFGTGIMAGGFLLNNELTDFSFRPKDRAGRAVANRVEGGKRPRSSMSPTIVFDGAGQVKAVLGSPGGTRIILYVVKSLVALIDWKMTAQQAAALPNFGSRNYGAFELEATGDTAALVSALELKRHTVRASPMTSGTHIIVVRPDGFEGGADPRREGIALGD